MKKRTVIITAAALVVLAGMIAAAVIRGRSGFEGYRVKDQDSYTLRFDRMNQTDSHFLSLHKGDVLAVEHAVEKGRVDLLILSEKEEAIYRGNDIDTGAYELTVPEDGNYRITVAAKHAGGYIYVRVSEE